MRHIRDCFHAKFGKICTQVQRLNEFSTAVKRHLPEFLHQHCDVLGFQNGCLILETSDATWASQLRYVLPELRDKLRTQEKWYQLTSIKIIIKTDSPVHSPPRRLPLPTKTSPWKTILQSLQSEG